MAKSKRAQKAVRSNNGAVQANGNSATYGRTRNAARDGIATAATMMALLNAICMDHSEEAEMDPELLLKTAGKAQGLIGLGIRAASEARRNPQFKSPFFLTA